MKLNILNRLRAGRNTTTKRTAIASVLAVLLAVSYAESARAIIPNPRISTRATIYANVDSANRNNVKDNSYSTSWDAGNPSVGSPSWIAFDLGTNAYSRLILVWYKSEWRFINDLGGGAPVNYQVQVSPDSSNGSNGAWTTVATVTGNIFWAGQVAFNSLGYRWVRFYITATSGTCPLGGIDLQDISAGASDLWFFQGDSITYEGWEVGVNNRGPSFQQRISASFPGFYPAQAAGGFGGTQAGSGGLNGGTVIDTYLPWFSNSRFWGLSYGMNDVLDQVYPNVQTNAYRLNMQYMIDKLKARGITPVIPRISYSNDGRHSAIPYFNMIVDGLTAQNNLPPGPDLYAWFLAHPGQLRDGVHYTEEGYTNFIRLWAEAMLPLYRSGIIVTNVAAVPATIINSLARTVVFTLRTESRTGSVTDVSMNLAPLGGPAVAKMSNIGASLYRCEYTVAPGVTAGVKTLPVMVRSSDGRMNPTQCFSVTVADALSAGPPAGTTTIPIQAADNTAIPGLNSSAFAAVTGSNPYSGN